MDPGADLGLPACQRPARAQLVRMLLGGQAVAQLSLALRTALLLQLALRGLGPLLFGNPLLLRPLLYLQRLALRFGLLLCLALLLLHSLPLLLALALGLFLLLLLLELVLPVGGLPLGLLLSSLFLLDLLPVSLLLLSLLLARLLLQRCVALRQLFRRRLRRPGGLN